MSDNLRVSDSDDSGVHKGSHGGEITSDSGKGKTKATQLQSGGGTPGLKW